MTVRRLVAAFALVIALTGLGGADSYFPEELKGRYETRVEGHITALVPLERFGYIAVVDKGKADGVKPKTMAIVYGVRTDNASVAVAANFIPITPADVNPTRFQRPYLGTLDLADHTTTFFFWTYNASVADLERASLDKGGTFAYPAPKVGDAVWFATAK